MIVFLTKMVLSVKSFKLTVKSVKLEKKWGDLLARTAQLGNNSPTRAQLVAPYKKILGARNSLLTKIMR